MGENSNMDADIAEVQRRRNEVSISQVIMRNNLKRIFISSIVVVVITILLIVTPTELFSYQFPEIVSYTAVFYCIFLMIIGCLCSMANIRHIEMREYMPLFEIVYILYNLGFLWYYNYEVYKAGKTIGVLLFMIVFFATILRMKPIRYVMLMAAEFISYALLLLVCGFEGVSLEQIISFLAVSALAFFINRESYNGHFSYLKQGYNLKSEAKSAETDKLTGLNNRTNMERYVKEYIAKASINGDKVGVVIMDIDFFKKYNDTYGHPMGDQCLKTVAGIIKECIDEDVCYAVRVGGEEFMLLFYGLTNRQMEAVCEKIREKLRERCIPHSQGVEPYVTMSMGLATVDADDADFHALYKSADNQLYKAKENGRNQLKKTSLRKSSTSRSR